MTISRRRFEATEEELAAHIEQYVDEFIASLQSFFLVMPRGQGFVEFNRFERAYNVLANATQNFHGLSDVTAQEAIHQDPLVLVVLRVMTGLSPPELAYLAHSMFGTGVDQGSARRLDKRAREGGSLLAGVGGRTRQQVLALISTAVQLLRQGAPVVPRSMIHRLDKADTREGLSSLLTLSSQGVPYVVLLYERFLERSFATHRDTVSEEVGDVLEEAVKEKMDSSGISYYKTERAERFEDMDQGPDFFVPNQFAPRVVIEAKLAEDDGTARDKVTRIQHLSELRDRRSRLGAPTFELVACVEGRGFGIRREDVKKLLFATKGKLFTLQTVDNIVEFTGLRSLSQR